MSAQQLDGSALIRSALSYAMENQASLSVVWDCVTLSINGDHVAFSVPDANHHQEKAAAIQEATSKIWFELHPSAVI